MGYYIESFIHNYSGLTTETIDAFRIQNESREGAKSPKFWIDEIEFRASGAALKYTVEPDQGTWFHIMSYQTLFVDVYDANSADASVPAISYNKIVAMIPTTGYVNKRYSEEKTDPIHQYRILNLMDLMSRPGSKLGTIVSDGNTMMTISQDEPIPCVLKAEDLDKIVISVEDDFSQLLYFRICVHGYVEQRE